MLGEHSPWNGGPESGIVDQKDLDRHADTADLGGFACANRILVTHRERMNYRGSIDLATSVQLQ
jgi:hypothetical protein